MKDSKAMKIWNLLYPICIYFVVTSVSIIILNFLLPETTNSKLFRQLLTSIAAFPFLLSFYRQDQKSRNEWKKQPYWKMMKIRPADFFWMFVTGGCFAVALNNLFGMMRLGDYSASYAEITKTFYTGRLLLEIFALCMVIPIVEELLYRGIVYKRAVDWLGARYAAVVSALIFGLIHMNLVQFIYASLFGLLLAYFAEVTGNLTGAIAAHMAANLTSVLRTETRVFAFLDQSMIVQVLATVLLALIAAAGVFGIWRRNGGVKNNSEEEN